MKITTGNNHKQPEEQPSVWVWVGIGITAFILMIILNAPRIMEIFTPSKAPSFSQERIQEEVESTFSEEEYAPEEEVVSYEYEFINDFILEDLSNRDFDAEWQQGSTELYLTAVFPENKNVYWSWGWCALDQETLEENFDHLELWVTLNNENVNSLLFQGDYQYSDVVCREFDLSVIDWYPGQLILYIEIIFTEDINDGISDQIFPAAAHIIEYQITVTE